jgi:DNA-binding transcriptional ArsR family regulator
MERYKKALDKARSANFEILSSWHMFEMKADPFLSPLKAEATDFFANREKIIEEIIFNIGVAQRGIPTIILFVGPTGVGKTATLNQVHNILKMIEKEEPKKYRFSGEVYSANYLFSCADEIDEHEGDMQPWLTHAREKKDYMLVDDSKAEQVRTISREFVQTGLKLFAISSLDYEETLHSLPATPKIICIGLLEFEDAITMLERRIERALIDTKKKISVHKLFDDDALKFIWKCSQGMPLLILKNASKSLEILAETRSEKVTLETATTACKITKCLQAFKEFENMSKAKLELVHQILDEGRSPTELSAKLQKDRTTVSRQLSELSKEGLVDITYKGRESIYKATEPVKIAVELKAMPKV